MKSSIFFGMSTHLGFGSFSRSEIVTLVLNTLETCFWCKAKLDLEAKNQMECLLEAKDDFMERICNFGSVLASYLFLVSNPWFLEMENHLGPLS